MSDRSDLLARARALREQVSKKPSKEDELLKRAKALRERVTEKKEITVEEADEGRKLTREEFNELMRKKGIKTVDTPKTDKYFYKDYQVKGNWRKNSTPVEVVTQVTLDEQQASQAKGKGNGRGYNNRSRKPVGDVTQVTSDERKTKGKGNGRGYNNRNRVGKVTQVTSNEPQVKEIVVASVTTKPETEKPYHYLKGIQTGGTVKAELKFADIMQHVKDTRSANPSKYEAQDARQALMLTAYSDTVAFLMNKVDFRNFQFTDGTTRSFKDFIADKTTKKNRSYFGVASAILDKNENDEFSIPTADESRRITTQPHYSSIKEEAGEKVLSLDAVTPETLLKYIRDLCAKDFTAAVVKEVDGYHNQLFDFEKGFSTTVYGRWNSDGKPASYFVTNALAFKDVFSYAVIDGEDVLKASESVPKAAEDSN